MDGTHIDLYVIFANRSVPVLMTIVVDYVFDVVVVVVVVVL